MKIKCEFCGNMFPDTRDQCPNCGAPNQNVRRAANDQPVTIEQLQQWYRDRGLPPAETTRFFIGQDYKGPRAFGIYREETTGEYVVYKNKADGSRAERYRGTDQAYAVGELYQRLKQEIVEQKARSGEKNRQKKSSGAMAEAGGCLKSLVLWTVGVITAFALFIMGLGTLLTLTEPRVGYYDYNGGIYYRSQLEYDNLYWFEADAQTGQWSGPVQDTCVPQVLNNRKTGKAYYLGEDWKATIPCEDFSQSIYRADMDTGMFLSEGYYVLDGTVYYHMVPRHEQAWFVYEQDWQEQDYSTLPYELRHTSLATQYYTAEVLQVRDFRDTLFYADYETSREVKKGYYQHDSQVYYHLAEDYETGWYTWQGDDWTEAQSLPEAFSHPSLVEDFYFTPTWDAATQYTDFESTALYSENKDNWNNSDSSSYDWGSNDSWDSADTDWDSDW